MILITGNLGFIGTHLTKELSQKKIPWIGYDLLNGQDIRSKYQLDEFFEKEQITEIVHLAALAGVRRSKKYPKEYIDTNILGTQNIVDIAEQYNVKKIIFYSSSSVYGNVKFLPVKEDNDKNPISLYGITKFTAEQIVKNFNGQSTIVRPFTVYGENGRKDEVIYRWINQIKNDLPITVYDLESCRGYVYIKDLVNTTIELILKDWNWKTNDFNIGGSEVIYLKDIVNEFKKHFKDLKIIKQKRMEEDVYRQYTNTDKIERASNFKPEKRFIKNLNNILKQNSVITKF